MRHEREELSDYWKRSGRKVVWSTLLRHELEESLDHDPVVLIPIGSVEQHGPACPPDVDIANSYGICLRTAQSVDDFPCLVLPPLPFGLTPYNMGWVGTVTLELETAVGLLHDVCRSLHRQGFVHQILVNGHGGNVPLMGAAATKLSQEGIFVGWTSIWDLAPDELATRTDRDRGSIGHGGEMETSLQLYLRPFLVDMDRAVADTLPEFDPRARTQGMGLIELLRETRTGTMGDATVANAEKGRAVVDAAVERLQEMARWLRETTRVARGYTGDGDAR